MHLLCGPFRWPCGPGNTMPSASPNGAHPGLHRKPLDAAIGRAFAPITRADAMVIDFGLKNRVVAL